MEDNNMEIELHLKHNEVKSVFQLLGEKENDITYSVGYVLSKSPKLLEAFLKQIYGKTIKTESYLLRLQTFGPKDKGYTDLEIETDETYTIIEAKKGWILPSKKQLNRYSKRYNKGTNKGKKYKMVALTQCTVDYARINLPKIIKKGVPVVPYSWKKLWSLAKKLQKNSRGYEKQMLGELIKYLGGLMEMQKYDSNWVLVVPISKEKEKGWKISWIDIVEKKKKYFHPIGGSASRPKEPMNYIAFRYYGKLQSIHHVERVETTWNRHKEIPEIPHEKTNSPYYLYWLGPGFRPAHDVKLGKNMFTTNGHLCMLDTLFTFETVREAYQESNKRKKKHSK